jgi:hypothetical protein
MECDEPYLMLKEKTQPIQWIERPTGALAIAESLWPSGSHKLLHGFPCRVQLGAGDDFSISHEDVMTAPSHALRNLQVLRSGSSRS